MNARSRYEAVATIVEDDGDFNVTTNVTATVDEDDGKPTEVRVEVKTDDSTDKVVAESLDQAIKKIKEQIEVIRRKPIRQEQQKPASEHSRTLSGSSKTVQGRARDSRICPRKRNNSAAITVGQDRKTREIGRGVGTGEESRDRQGSRQSQRAVRALPRQAERARRSAGQVVPAPEFFAPGSVSVNINPRREQQVIRLKELAANGKPATIESDSPSIATLTPTRKRLDRLRRKSSTNSR